MTQVTFNPATCLKRAGFGGLRFKGVDSFNELGDWEH